MTKLFEFPDGATIDLNKVWLVEPLSEQPLLSSHNPGTYLLPLITPGDACTSSFVLTTFRNQAEKETAKRIAEQIRSRLLDRWGSTE